MTFKCFALTGVLIKVWFMKTLERWIYPCTISTIFFTRFADLDKSFKFADVKWNLEALGRKLVKEVSSVFSF